MGGSVSMIDGHIDDVINLKPCKRCLNYLECDEEHLVERIKDLFRCGYDCFVPKWEEDVV